MEERAVGPEALLNWKIEYVGFLPYQEAILGDFYGNKNDGVRFTLEHYRSCQVRGRWKLLIENGNPALWGFDENDQPLRFYHSEDRAKEEAEAIAQALFQERRPRGPAWGAV